MSPTHAVQSTVGEGLLRVFPAVSIVRKSNTPVVVGKTEIFVHRSHQASRVTLAGKNVQRRELKFPQREVGRRGDRLGVRAVKTSMLRGMWAADVTSR